MKKLTKLSLWLLFIVLILTNTFVFLQSIHLSDKINHFETEVKTLKRENISLENKIYEVNSLKYASSMAAQLDFSQKAQPAYLENLPYARSQ